MFLYSLVVYLWLACTACLALDHGQSNSTAEYSKNLLDESMNWLDMFYDSEVGYLFDLDSQALAHETRASAWYAAGLLSRNKGDDATQAHKIIKNVIEGQRWQASNGSNQWYGDYQIYPEEPSVGTDHYHARIYRSWDPNWRGFVGTTFILILEEFPELIPYHLKGAMIDSLYNTSIGDSYRVGGIDGDNLYPSYSNPSIMRALVSGWVGRHVNDTNMTRAGEHDASAIIDLFNRANTLSEFNSGTYAGVSLFALTLWAKYMPETSLMGKNGGRMIEETWKTLGGLYNANLKNLAGPWDRAYGFDMQKYLSILALQIWTLVGKDEAPVNHKPYAMGHKNDFAIGPLVAILAPFHNTFVPNSTISSLNSFPGTHTVSTSAFSPPYDTYPRNISAWISPNLTIGAVSFSQDRVGGAVSNPSQFNPAVVQWRRQDNTVGFLTLYAQVKELDAIVEEGALELTYPSGNANSTFEFLIGTNSWNGKRNVLGWNDVEGVDVVVNGSVNLDFEVTFHGLRGGAGDVINGFEFWKFTYSMPEDSDNAPRIRLGFSSS